MSLLGFDAVGQLALGQVPRLSNYVLTGWFRFGVPPAGWSAEGQDGGTWAPVALPNENWSDVVILSNDEVIFDPAVFAEVVFDLSTLVPIWNPRATPAETWTPE